MSWNVTICCGKPRGDCDCPADRYGKGLLVLGAVNWRDAMSVAGSMWFPKYRTKVMGAIQAEIRNNWSWYLDFMLQRRIGALTAKNIHVTAAVIDGNANLCRRFCGRPVAELLHCVPLNRYSAADCSLKPCRGQK